MSMRQNRGSDIRDADGPGRGGGVFATTAPNRDRILGYDLARSFAMLGMIVFHFALVMAHDTTRPGWLAFLVGLLDGRAATLFVVLAGVGLTLRSRNIRDDGSASAVRRTLILRGIFLFAFGFLNLRIWEGDIPRVYGVSLLLAAWFTEATSRRLLLVAAWGLAFFALAVKSSWAWKAYFRHGPLEWLMRRVAG